jgi:hypothetical protein
MDNFCWKMHRIDNIKFSQTNISLFFKNQNHGHLFDLIKKLHNEIQLIHKDYNSYHYASKEDDPIFKILQENSISVINHDRNFWTISNRRFFCIKYVLQELFNFSEPAKIWIKYYESEKDYRFGEIFQKKYNETRIDLLQYPNRIDINDFGRFFFKK